MYPHLCGGYAKLMKIVNNSPSYMHFQLLSPTIWLYETFSTISLISGFIFPMQALSRLFRAPSAKEKKEWMQILKERATGSLTHRRRLGEKVETIPEARGEGRNPSTVLANPCSHGFMEALYFEHKILSSFSGKIIMSLMWYHYVAA